MDKKYTSRVLFLPQCRNQLCRHHMLRCAQAAKKDGLRGTDTPIPMIVSYIQILRWDSPILLHFNLKTSELKAQSAKQRMRLEMVIHFSAVWRARGQN